QLVRAWERRYAVVEPVRADSGYRLYDEKAIARLRAMRRLVDEGWAPSTAAVRVREMNDDEVREVADRNAATDAARPPAGASVARNLAHSFVGAGAKLDERRA